MNNEKIRVLIVDDSFFMRKLLRDLFRTDPGIEVIGEAKDGSEALGEAARLHPDVITMDYNMPKIDGLEAVKEILKDVSPPPAIIMLSAHTLEGAQITLDCLQAGAVDFVSKPSGELSLDIDKVSEEILTKIRIAAHAKVQKHDPISPKKVIKKVSKQSPVKVIIIGSSTGGPPVVEEIISGLFQDLKATVVVAQHMPAGFTFEFAQRLDKISNLTVSEAKEGDNLEVGHCFVCPGGVNTEIIDGQIRISLSESKLTPSINKLMESAGRNYGSEVLGIILTGMGEDGAEGILAIKKAGGQAIAQNPQTAVIVSMPQTIIDAGLADFILTPLEIINKISS